MTEIILENAIKIIAALMMVLISALGTWVGGKLAKKAELAGINAAIAEAVSMARITVDELQQTMVEGLKAAHADGKLTKGEIELLSKELVRGAIGKMSEPARDLLDAAGVNVVALIQGAGEAWIAGMKKNNQ